jgi:hypothetical protein
VVAFESRAERSAGPGDWLGWRWSISSFRAATAALAGLLSTCAEASAGQECPREVEVELRNQLPTPEDTHGQIHRHGRALNELHDLHSLARRVAN